MKPLSDSSLKTISYRLSEYEHHYGPNVHLVSDPVLSTLLSRLCSIETTQPEINHLVRELYHSLLVRVIANEFPQLIATTRSRMSEKHPEGVFENSIIAPTTPVVTVNLARAGTLPSLVCYDFLNHLMDPKTVRQDHISISRQTDPDHRVTGSAVSGHKIGGRIDGSMVLIPDPMGATGSTIVETLELYSAFGKAKKWIALHCIVTPEYLKKIKTHCPGLTVYALRLDRGLSPASVLETTPGTHWDLERGLNDQQYIVPGGGGFGEIMNNAYV